MDQDRRGGSFVPPPTLTAVLGAVVQARPIAVHMCMSACTCVHMRVGLVGLGMEGR